MILIISCLIVYLGLKLGFPWPLTIAVGAIVGGVYGGIAAYRKSRN